MAVRVMCCGRIDDKRGIITDLEEIIGIMLWCLSSKHKFRARFYIGGMGKDSLLNR